MTTVEVLRIPVVMLCGFVLPGYLGQMVFLLRDRRVTDTVWWEVSLGAVLAGTPWTDAWRMVLLQLGRFSLRALPTGNVAVSLYRASVTALRRLPWHPRVHRVSTHDAFLLAAQVAIWQSEDRSVVPAEGSHAVLEVSYEHKPQEIWTHTMDIRFYEALGGQ